MLWLLATLTFTYRNYQSEKLMISILDGKPHAPSEYIAAANGAVAWFPFDQHVRNTRAWVLDRIAQAEQSNAASEPSAKTPDVGGGK